MRMLKKMFFIIIWIFILMLPQTSFAAVDMDAKPLVFTPDTSGKYIYCNNHEFIRRNDLADTSNPNAKYIMNNTLEAGKYAMFVSHVNHTEVRDSNNSIVETGFDVEVDVVFKAKEDTEIVVTAVGFEVPDHSKYYYNGEEYKFEEAWGCMNAWADYLGMPIKELDSSMTYPAHSFEPVSIHIPAGEQVWLSRYIRDYKPVPFYRPVLLLADFEVISGKTEANVAAVKSTGTPGDRRYVHHSPAFGYYDRDKQYKGIADSLNRLETNLEYTIADWVGGELPVTVYNDYVPNGNTITHWDTNINPYADPWNKVNAVGSDMLSFKYEDDSKLKYYGADISEDKRDNVWVFENNRSDFSSYPGRSSKISYNKYIPNDIISTEYEGDGAGNFGNYGVKLDYKVTITNEGKITRYVYYDLATISNNIVILKDENDIPVNDYAICKGYHENKESDTMACVEIPAGTKKTFIIEVILPTNYVGGMENSLSIQNEKYIPKVYDRALQKIPIDLGFTGREYIKWNEGRLYKSYDKKEWDEVPISKEVEQIFHGNWNQFRIMYTDNGYMVKPSLYDSKPYYGIREFYKTVYFLDNNFELVSSHTFYQYPTDMSYAKGKYYVTAGSVYVSDDTVNWEMTDGSYLLPADNGRLFSVRKSGRDVYYSIDGDVYTKGLFESEPPDFSECSGDIYYYTKGDNLYVSFDGMYFDRIAGCSPLESISKVGSTLLVNGREFKLEYSAIPHVCINGNYVIFKNKPYEENGRIYVPYNYLRNVCPETNAMTDDMLTVRNGETYVGIAAYCERNGYTVSYDEALHCAVVSAANQQD